jgi:hypothetical protein
VILPPGVSLAVKKPQGGTNGEDANQVADGVGASRGTVACDDPTEAIMTGMVTDLLRV